MKRRTQERVLGCLVLVAIFFAIHGFSLGLAGHKVTLASTNDVKSFFDSADGAPPANSAFLFRGSLTPAPEKFRKVFPLFAPGGVPVLMYHHIGDVPANADPVRRDLTVTTQDFLAQVQYLKLQGYHSISTEQLNAALHNGPALPSKPVLFTFDDGYTDVFQNAMPILQQNGYTGTVAIICGFADQKAPGYADWDVIKAAHAQGVEIINHSFAHIDFNAKSYSNTDRSYQIQTCADDIQNHLGVKNTSFVYPYGHFNSETEQLLTDKKIAVAFTTRFGKVAVPAIQNLLELPRVRVHGGEPIDIFIKLLGK